MRGALRTIAAVTGLSFSLIANGAGQALPQGGAAAKAPDAPKPQAAARTPLPVGPCDLRNAAASMAATAAFRANAVAENDTAVIQESPRIIGVTLCVPHLALINWYARFLNGPQVKPLTPLEKAHLAGRNVVDPSNLLTIAGEGALAVASNPHSPDGPGMHGYANYLGVSLTQDMVGEFFGTFLIPAVTREDPHYHRMPGVSIKRRVLHAIDQVVWTQGDNGRNMVNYADVVGFAGDEAVNNLFVPDEETNLPATAARYGLDLATAPIDNFITEFLPDIASHIHVRIVLVQRIINQVARPDMEASP
jgi:hypothetical protein